MEESELIFSLNRQDEGPMVAFSKDKAGSRPDPSLGFELGLDLGQRRHSKTFHVPLSPSSPGSLADLSACSARPFSSTSLVKSLSTELDSKETGSIRPKPLLSLVKSLSTEISRHGEPEVNLSKSDSKLHMHPWKQLTKPKLPEATSGAGAASKEDAWTDLSPTEPRGSSLIAEFEDTRRKFSEAMQDPLSMLNKIMGEESSGSPKQRRCAGAGDSPSPLACAGGGSGTPLNSEDGSLHTQGPRCRKKTEKEVRSVCETPLRTPKTAALSPEKPHRGHTRTPSRDSHFEICTYGDVIEVVEVQGGSEEADVHGSSHPVRVPGASVPRGWLFLVGLLAYGFFVLPLPSYITGLSLGLACGFMLGLLVVLVLTPRQSAWSPRSQAEAGAREHHNLPSIPLSGAKRDTEVLEGWMNEIHAYDPETYHPSLTHSVYATLDGSRLHLAYPRTNIPRQATFEEHSHEAVFVRSRTYQLADCKVSLLPPVLARKRVWNKKYPICIILADGEVEEVSLIEGQEEEERTDKQTFPDTFSDLPVTLYLFGRTGREKEEWFQHFLSASRPEFKRCQSIEGSKSEAMSSKGSISGSTEDLVPPTGLRDLAGGIKERVLLDYSSYMTSLVGSESSSPTRSPCHSDHGSPTVLKRIPSEEASAGGSSAEGQTAWVNSLVGRIFWDFLREKYWADQVTHKIQKKLSKIRLPYFMNELTLADLDMGICMPQVLSTSKPSLDHRGLWLELEVVYAGCLQMTLETKMNLCKLGKESGAEAHRIPEARQVGSKPRLCVLADSDEESSSAGSSDEEDLPPSEPQGTPGEKGTPPLADGHGGSTSRKILRFMDKIAKSKYFQKATENEYIKKKIAEVSNMPLMLTVEVLELSGTLAVNIPPPPTDRIWYSFRVPPRLDLRVRPMLGEREVTFTHVTEWIERKLTCEFQKVFVMPNMDDLYLPLMTSGLDNPPPFQHSPALSSHHSSDESQEFVSE
ncbi:testis-expressed protein 2-like [Osmerus mordax]|uniref:testis-expressed protein 2-like n=1 Tax=Osmerus mordax TaxID=8014 RepID=UPI00351081DD